MGSIIEENFPELLLEKQWMNQILVKNPNFIINLHEKYIKCGADIITSFTFRTNPFAVNYFQIKNSVNLFLFF